MLKNFLRYLIVLLCTGAFFICFNGYFSMYVFLLSLALPVLSLLLSLPGMLTLQVTVCVPGEEGTPHTAKAQPVPLHVAAVTKSPLPAGRARLRLSITNHFTGEAQAEKLEFSPSRMPQILEHKLTSGTCGVISCQLTKARAYDLLGLFWLPVRLKKAGRCQLVVMPTVHRPILGLGQTCSWSSDGERFSPHKPGRDPTELFGLRDYRPGDRLSRVDWKLSQKTGELLVREASLPLADQALLLLDLSGTGLESDGLMDVVATLTQFLIEEKLEYMVGFSQAGRWVFLPVTEPEEALLAEETVLRTADCRSPKPPQDMPGGVSRVVYLCPKPDLALLGQLSKKYPGARQHMVSLDAWGERASLPPEILPVRVRLGSVAEDLQGLML